MEIVKMKTAEAEIEKQKDIIKANNIFTIYNNYHNEALNQLEATLKSVFGFETENDNGKINFEMGGCGYDCYLSRGYIVLEEEDNSSIENVWNADSVEELVDLIKDLKEDK